MKLQIFCFLLRKLSSLTDFVVSWFYLSIKDIYSIWLYMSSGFCFGFNSIYTFQLRLRFRWNINLFARKGITILLFLYKNIGMGIAGEDTLLLGYIDSVIPHGCSYKLASCVFSSTFYILNSYIPFAVLTKEASNIPLSIILTTSLNRSSTLASTFISNKYVYNFVSSPFVPNHIQN